MLDLKPLLTAAVENGFEPVYEVDCLIYGKIDAKYCKKCQHKMCQEE